MTRERWSRLTTLLAISVPVLVAPAQAEAPPRAESGQMLVVPDAQLDRGDVYHFMLGDDAQLIAISDAPLQRVLVHSRRIAGYVVSPFDRKPSDPPIVAGACRIPVASLDAGNEELNGLLRGPALFNAAEHPEITVELTGVSDFKRVSEEGKPESFELTLQCRVTVKGQTFDREFPAKVTILPFTWQTMARYPGDLISIRVDAELAFADFGLAKPAGPMAQRIADKPKISVFLLGNTVPPEKSLDPAVKGADLVRELRFMTLLRDLGKAEEAYAFGREYMKKVWDDAPALNRLAWTLLTEPGIRERDLGFVLELSLRANEITKNAEPPLLDTLARTYFERGEYAKAADTQRTAISNLKDTPAPQAAPYHEALKRYERRAAETSGGAAKQ